LVNNRANPKTSRYVLFKQEGNEYVKKPSHANVPLKAVIAAGTVWKDMTTATNKQRVKSQVKRELNGASRKNEKKESHCTQCLFYDAILVHFIFYR
jgi:hypothetical protein